MLVHLVVVLLLTCGTRFGRDAGFDARAAAVASQVGVGESIALRWRDCQSARGSILATMFASNSSGKGCPEIIYE